MADSASLVTVTVPQTRRPCVLVWYIAFNAIFLLTTFTEVRSARRNVLHLTNALFIARRSFIS
jgi:hypothetical protein